MTFAVLNRRVHALAGHLQSENIQPGDRVGVLLPNCTAIPLIYFATQKIGAVSVILDARLKGKELQGVLQDADLKLLVVHQQLFAEVANACKEIPPSQLGSSKAKGNRASKSAMRYRLDQRHCRDLMPTTTH